MLLYLFVLGVIVYLALVGLGYWISSVLLHPRRQVATHTPEKYRLDYENASFESKDGLSLKGWWIEGRLRGVNAQSRADPVVILLHPMFGNRAGTCPARRRWPAIPQGEVDLLRLAHDLHRAGYSVLLFDFRNHGESGSGLSAGGLNEDQDVAGAVDYVFIRMTAEAPDETPQVGIVAFGLGASAAISAIGRERGGSETIRVFSADNEGAAGLTEFPPANIKKLCFLVAVEPGSLRVYARRLFLPLSLLLVPIVDWFCQWRGGYPLDGALLGKFAREVNVPVLYVQGCAGDGHGEVQQLYDVTPGPKQLWSIETPLGSPGTYAYVANHLERILAFTVQYVSGLSGDR